jgi:DNA repair ATPase RecN
MINLGQLERLLDVAKTRLAIAEVAYTQSLEAVEAESKKVREASEEAILLSQVNDLLVNFADVYKRIVVERIEALITEGLQTIREDPNLSFKIVTEQKRGNLEVVFKVWDEELQHEIDLKNDAGSVRQIVSALLRIILIVLTNANSAPIILDEIGDGISVEYQENFGKFLQHLSQKLGVQIIMITHRGAVAASADKEFRFERNKKGVSRLVGGI